MLERLELAEQKLAQFSIRNEAMGDAMDEKNKQDALSQVYIKGLFVLYVIWMYIMIVYTALNLTEL